MKYQKEKLHLITGVVLMLFSLLVSCANERKPRRNSTNENKENTLIEQASNYSNTPKTNSTVTQLNELQGVNVFFENSLSMNGYLGGTSFKTNMFRIDEFASVYGEEYHSYFVNTEEHQITNFWKRIEKKQIKKGNIYQSNHEFILNNALNKALNDRLSIVITDGIYSVSNGDLDIVPLDIERAFKDVNTNDDIATYVIKLSSNYNGTYYYENCEDRKQTKINQERPYYILLFGKPNHINEFLDAHKKDLVGIKEFTNFTNRTNYSCDYTVLTKGEEKIGDFESISRSVFPVLNIKDAEKGTPNRASGKNQLQFVIAINLNDLSLSQNYLLDNDNYTLNNTKADYSIESIKAIEKLDKNSKTYHELEKIEERRNKKYSHIIVVNSSAKIYGDINIKLKKQLPEWIKQTGTNNDCDIVENTSQTIAFDRLINGISKAYKRTTDKDDYIEFSINIKH
ncbi:hypothetical protein FHR24_001570 [Wenyingzhuangia heitensis]|uniref:Lipoprotein n=1 Tax=Wenyingzhuangia heitensis TaxID=1487859 RepID=A0ABX0UCC9_9FLAO|nr:hypothetical protein [Wenyingzhuangia heitensis]NIJ45131.1 hypothetical protein [Wenyingzhuangia heitensis]